jgi:hypothetical protein
MYDIRDIINKAIALANQKRELYIKACEDINAPDVLLVLKVVLKTIEKEIEHYNTMIKNITNEMAEGIDFATYDKVSSLVAQFSKIMIAPKLHNKNELVLFIIDLEEQIYALLVDIQGRMVTNEAVASTVSYYVLNELISEKEQYISNLRGFVGVREEQ